MRAKLMLTKPPSPRNIQKYKGWLLLDKRLHMISPSLQPLSTFSLVAMQVIGPLNPLS